MDEDHANEANELLKKIMTKPYGVLVNTANDYSFKFEGASKIGNLPLEKKVAVLTYSKLSEKAMNSVASMQNINFPNKEFQFFDNREDALQWLNEK